MRQVFFFGVSDVHLTHSGQETSGSALVTRSPSRRSARSLPQPTCAQPRRLGTPRFCPAGHGPSSHSPLLIHTHIYIHVQLDMYRYIDIHISINISYVYTFGHTHIYILYIYIYMHFYISMYRTRCINLGPGYRSSAPKSWRSVLNFLRGSQPSKISNLSLNEIKSSYISRF